MPKSKAPSEKSTARDVVGVRLTKQQIGRLDGLVSATSAETGVAITRSGMLAAVVERGLQSYEQERRG